MSATPVVDPRAFRDVMGHYPTGVVVVTGLVNGEPIGMVVGTFSSVSLEPPLVSFMPMTTSATYATLRKAESICISVFADDQQTQCRNLASKDPEKFEKVAWTPNSAGVPQIDGAVAHIHGRIVQEVEAGDHYITLVAVDDLAVHRATAPLLFFQGGCGSFSTKGLTAHVDESLISAVRVAELARPQLDSLAERLGCSAAAYVQISALDQTIGASSYGSESTADERIGVRIPLIPPLGDASIAWSEEQVNAWLGRAFPTNDETARSYLATVERIKHQGYAISLYAGDVDSYNRLRDAMAEWADGELTPARDRAVRGVIAESGKHFGGSISAEDKGLDLASIVVPVLDPTSEQPQNSGLVLRLGDLPSGVDGATALEWVDALKAAAAEVAETLAGTGSKAYGRYTGSGLRQD